MLKKYKPKGEKELHSIIKKHLADLNLELIKYEFSYKSSIPDFLCVDQNGSLVIIEVKLETDKNIIAQAIRYYKMVEESKYIIAKANSKINPDEYIKIILISEDYTPDSKNIIEFLNLDINLYTYLTLIDEETKKIGIYFNEVEIPITTIIKLLEFKTIDDHRNYFSNDNLKAIFDSISAEIKSFKAGIEDYATQKYVGFRLKGKIIAFIPPRRTFFWLITGVFDEEGSFLENSGVKIVTGKEDKIAKIYALIKDTIKRIEE